MVTAPAALAGPGLLLGYVRVNAARPVHGPVFVTHGQGDLPFQSAAIRSESRRPILAAAGPLSESDRDSEAEAPGQARVGRGGM